MTLFLGHDADYWMELEKLAQEQRVVHVVEELAKVRRQLYIAEGKLNAVKNILYEAGEE